MHSRILPLFAVWLVAALTLSACTGQNTPDHTGITAVAATITSSTEVASAPIDTTAEMGTAGASALGEYTLQQRIGSTADINTPIDVLAMPGRTTLIVDGVPGCVIAVDAENRRLEWGDIDSTCNANPLRLARDSSNRVYVLFQGGEVHRFHADGTRDVTWALDWGFGPGIVPGGMGLMTGITVDASDNVYLSAFPRALDSADTALVMQFLPDGTQYLGWDLPADCVGGDLAAGPENTIFIACERRVFQLDTGGELLDRNGNGVLTPLGSSHMVWSAEAVIAETYERLQSISVAADGTLLVLHRGVAAAPTTPVGDSDWMVRLTAHGEVVSTWPVPRHGYAALAVVRMDINDDEHLYVPDPTRSQVLVFAQDGQLLSTVRDTRPDASVQVTRIALRANGDVYLLDQRRAEIRRFAQDGQFIEVIPIPTTSLHPSYTSQEWFTGRLYDAWDLVVTPEGIICLALLRPNTVLAIAPDGQLLYEIDLSNTPSTNSAALALTNDTVLVVAHSAGEQLFHLNPHDGQEVQPQFEMPAGVPPPYLGGDMVVVGDMLYTLTRKLEGYTDWLSTSVYALRADGHDSGIVAAIQPQYLEGMLRVTARSDGEVFAAGIRDRSDIAVDAVDVLLYRFDAHGVLTGTTVLPTTRWQAVTDLLVSSSTDTLYVLDGDQQQVLVYAKSE